VQKVVTTTHLNTALDVFYEAWEVEKGVVYAGYKTNGLAKEKQGVDLYGADITAATKKGEFLKVQGNAKFIPGIKLDWKLGNAGGVPQSGLLPSSRNPPPGGWGDDKGTVERRFNLTFTDDVTATVFLPNLMTKKNIFEKKVTLFKGHRALDWGPR